MFRTNTDLPAAVIFVANGLHINDYLRGRPFSLRSLCKISTAHVSNLDLRAMHTEPFAYFCLSPWPKFGCIKNDVVSPLI